jgi:hypothetical protein
VILAEVNEARQLLALTVEEPGGCRDMDRARAQKQLSS